MVYDISDKHNTSYDSHNSEIAATPVQSVALENIGDTYSIADTLKFDVSNLSCLGSFSHGVPTDV